MITNSKCEEIRHDSCKYIIFSNFEKKIASLFFSRENIHKTFIIFPKFFPIYQLNNFLKKDFQKKKAIQPNFHNKIFKKNIFQYLIIF